MKKTLFFSLILFISTNYVVAQNYQCITADAYYLFLDGSSYNGFAVDSINIEGTDNIYHITKQIREVYSEYFTHYGANFIGHTATEKANGDFIFYNTENEEILIKSLASLNETWTCYTYPNGNYIEAFVFAHDTLTFLDITDSVKTIHFITKNTEHAIIENGTDTMQLQLSKQHGFVELVKFYVFPDKNSVRYYYSIHSGEPTETCTKLLLAGKSNPQIGMKNVTYSEAFDYEVGDEFHYYYYTVSFSNYRSTTRKSIYTVTGIDENEDFLSYAFDICEYEGTLYSPYNSSEEYSSKHYHKTNTLIINRDASFDMLYKQVILVNRYYLNSCSYVEINGRIGKSLYNISIKPINDSIWCLSNIAEYSPLSSNIYEGLGKIYYYHHDPCHFWEEKKNLVYYKKGNEQWGTPYDCETLSISDYNQNNSINIYPNPANFQVIIQNNRQLIDEIGIFDLTSKLIKKIHSIDNHKIEINIADLNLGFYLLKIKSGEQILNGKFIKQ